MDKMDIFQQQFKSNKQFFLAMISTEGLKKNAWSEELVTDEVKLVELF